jgi:hypothetical protein
MGGTCRTWAVVLGVVILWTSSLAARAETVTLWPAQDNTLYESPDGGLSNGSGDHLFAGVTAVGRIRRALLAFDVAAQVPPGATITGVSLSLHVSMTIAGTHQIALRTVSSSWGEGASVAAGEEGGGAPSQVGDATWLHRFYSTTTWIQPGGDFSASDSASSVVDQIGAYAFASAAMAADVQGWLNDPGSSFGWILIGDESQVATAKRFDSRSNPDPSLRPVLTVEYTTPVGLAGAVPDGSTIPGLPLTLERSGDLLSLAWGPSCNPADGDYAVYEGTMGSFVTIWPLLCSTNGGTTATVAPASENQFYLVVPQNESNEGSYGTTGAGAERPASSSACRPQAIGVCS